MSDPTDPNDLRELLKEHQEATDTDDDTMLRIVLDHTAAYMEATAKGAMEHFVDTLLDYVVERLERGPGDCS